MLFQRSAPWSRGTQKKTCEMTRPRMTMGKDAVVSVLSSTLHPITMHQDYVSMCGEVPLIVNPFVVHQETRKINRRDRMTIFHEK
jgi:hypothetical protein